MLQDNQDAAIDPSLLEFITGHGTQINHIAAAFVPHGGYRGIIATENIPNGTCVLRVPYKLLLSCHTARNDPELVAVGATTSLPSLALFALHLLHEIHINKERSFWAPYLASLPTHYTTAMHLPPNTDPLLATIPYAHRRIEHARSAARDLHQTALPYLQRLHVPTDESTWLWALSTLSSRTMYLDDESAGCLTPFGDLFNYMPPPPPYTPQLELEEEDAHPLQPQVEWGDGCVDPGTKDYCLYARRDYKKGEEIFLCYGRYTNLELFEHYGMVLTDNAHNTAVLPLASFPPTVQAYIRSDSIHASHEAIIHANGNPSWELLRALRLGGLCASERKLFGWKAVAKDAKVNDSSEVWAMETLIGVCKETSMRAQMHVEQGGGGGRGGASLCSRDVEADREILEVAMAWKQGYVRCLTVCIELCTQVLEQQRQQRQPNARGGGLSVSHAAHPHIRQPKFGRK